MPESLTRGRNGRGASLDLAKSFFSSGHRLSILLFVLPRVADTPSLPVMRAQVSIMRTLEVWNCVSEAASKSSLKTNNCPGRY